MGEVEEVDKMDGTGEGKSSPGFGKNAKRIVIAMSGGIDSSVAAMILVEQGWDVIGVHMRLSVEASSGAPHQDLEGAHERTCCSLRDAEDARAVAASLGIPFYILDFREDFEREVVVPFVEDYRLGRTPNPCVLCNEKLKLGGLLSRAKSYGAECVATGHYARCVLNESTGRYELHRPKDRAKDQTYYLFMLSQTQLAGFRTPLGDLTKGEARQLARERGLKTSDKPGSQDICFVPDNDYRKFLIQREGEESLPLGGNIVDRGGAILGHHEGIHNFTIGQRRGIGIGGPYPLYVVELRPESREVVVGGASELFATGLKTGPVNWIAIPGISGPCRARVQIRYRHTSVPALLEPLDDGGVSVTFDSPQRAVTPGQAAVFYDESNLVVLGGGWIRQGSFS